MKTRIQNGVYACDGFVFMSLWAFTRKYKINDAYHAEALCDYMRRHDVPMIRVPAELSNQYSMVNAYPENALKNYFNVK